MASRVRCKGTGGKKHEDTIAAALAMAATVGVKAAAKAFRLSERTLHRYKASCEADPTSDLAVAVNRARQSALRKLDDLVTSTWEAILLHIKELLPRADAKDTVEFAKVIGEHKLAAAALGVKDDASGTRSGPKAEEASGASEGQEGVGATVRRLERRSA